MKKIFSLVGLFFTFNIISAQAPTNGLIGYWPLDGNANDLSGNGRNGTINGPLSFATNLLNEANKCAQFLELSYINIGVIPDIRNDFTLSLLYKTTNPATANSNGEPTLIAIQPAENYGILFEKQSIGGSQLEIYNADRWGWGATGVSYVSSNTWTHVIVVYNRSSGSLIFYQNGVLIQNSTVTPNTLLSNPVTLKMLIGVRGTGGSELGKGEYFVGFMDNVRVYNVPLTPSEVSALYNSDITPSGGGTPPPTPLGLVATTIASNQIDLSWTTASTATNYTVEYSLSNSFTSPTIINSITTTSYSASGLAASTLYYFRVKANNAFGSSGYSSSAQATTSASGGGGGNQWTGSSTTSGGIARLGDVHIGKSTTNMGAETGYSLFVKNGIKSEKIKIELPATGGWADYIFNKDYHLLPIKEVEWFIKAHHHLPDFPSESSIIKAGGFEMGDMMKRQQVGIESLYLYIIELEKKVEVMKVMEKNYKALEMRLLHIERKLK